MAEKMNVPEIRFAGFTEPWEQKKLGEATKIFKSGDGINSNDINETDLFPVFGGNGLRGYTSTYNHDGEFALIGRQGALCGNMNFSYGKAYFTEHAIAVQANQENDTRFLYYLLRTMNLGQYSDQSAQPGLAVNKLIDLCAFIPMKAEQKRIQLLCSISDNLISLHQKKHTQLMTIKKAMLEKMFPKEGETVPEIRFAGFSKSWKSIQLCDIIKEVTRNDPLSSAPIMMITANQGFIPQSERYAFNNAGESLKKYTLLYQGELAYNHGASKLRPYGSCFNLSNVKEARIPYVYHCFSAENQNPEFMSITLNGINVENQLRRIVSSGARMDGLLNISFDEYASITLLLPTISEQNAIAKYFHNLDNLITLQQKKIDKLQHIKKAFLDKMFV